ncbi:MAG TPA: acyl-CoA dehydrogenase family protein [Bryobacteraceae bacterium]|nr:acyl-CoA dehydrogenase family protein [Bryobacteraceae bacterium]
MNHEVQNQAPPLVDIDLFSTDRALKEAVSRECAGWALGDLAAYGRELGSAETLECGALANAHPPILHTHDRYGNRRDEVEFHPAWHRMMRLAVENGVHSSPWANPRPGAHVARAAAAMLASECEAGHVCPVSMTYSSAPVLRRDPELAREWEPRIYSTRYDSSFQPAPLKTGALIGMAMTEKQGGSDVRTNSTRAEPIGNGEYVLDGHKWFCSAPMSDAFLVLAQAPAGLSCFFLPRWTPDGRRNAFHLQRLKAKLGNRSNASSEVEFDGAWARRIGEEGRGVATIIEMVHHTRLDCVIGAAALMRRALIETLHHTRHRQAFGRKLIDQPLMQNVLADLAIESEAATLFMMRIARAVDEGDRTFARLAVAAGKYWVSKRTPAHVAEALECLGGNGFVEESAMPRLYREAPLNSIWEGSGNVIALDVLRAIKKEPEALERVLGEIRLANDPRIERFLGSVRGDVEEAEARRFAERVAIALQASLLVRYSPAAVADGFLASRLDGDWGRAFGTLPNRVNFQSIISLNS